MQPNQVQLSSNHNLNSSLSTNLLISASSFSQLSRQSPLTNFNSSSILHPITHHNSHLVHSASNSLNPHSLPLTQNVLQNAQFLRNNYDSLLYVNGQLPSNNNLSNSINFNTINQLNQLTHHLNLNQLPIAAAAAACAAVSLQNENTQSDNLSVCSNLSAGSMKSEDTQLNSSNCGFNTAFKLNNSLKNQATILGNGQTGQSVNELKFSVNSILNANNYSNQLRNDALSSLNEFTRLNSVTNGNTDLERELLNNTNGNHTNRILNGMHHSKSIHNLNDSKYLINTSHLNNQSNQQNSNNQDKKQKKKKRRHSFNRAALCIKTF